MLNPLLSIVIPVGPGDRTWVNLLAQLSPWVTNEEIIICGPAAEEETLRIVWNEFAQNRSARWVVEGGGRARQLNRGGMEATGKFLWFLHADSMLDGSAFPKLYQSIEKRPERLHYFLLKFQKDGPYMTALNGWGAALRSLVFGMPFGDQGFCLERSMWLAVGRFPEGLSYGEDHVFVWRARQKGIKLQPVYGWISTSARKYRTKGWGRTTLSHLYLTWKQAVPEIWQLWRQQSRRSP